MKNVILTALKLDNLRRVVERLKTDWTVTGLLEHEACVWYLPHHVHDSAVSLGVMDRRRPRHLFARIERTINSCIISCKSHATQEQKQKEVEKYQQQIQQPEEQGQLPQPMN